MVYYLGFRDRGVPEYRYEDSLIDVQFCSENTYNSYLGNANINMDILINKGYQIGIHIESLEVIYLILDAEHDGFIYQQDFFRDIKLRIILHSQYKMSNHEEYSNGETITVNNIAVKYTYKEYSEPFYIYKASFSVNGLQCYLDYRTVDENDLSSFLQAFIT